MPTAGETRTAARWPGNARPAAARGAWTLVLGNGPVVALALHHGHELRPAAARRMALGEAERLREEDPGTAAWTWLAPTHVVVHRSRFEVDLNRPSEGAVYRTPEEAWGLEVWKGGPGESLVREGQAVHRAFYATLESLLRRLTAEHGRFVVYDLHSYNHRRGGPGLDADDPGGNPDVNLGTGSMDRERWGEVADAFLDSLSASHILDSALGRHPDVRENVRFGGGYLSRWVHGTFPLAGCALAVEVKKFFMDEWTGAVDEARLAAVGGALAGTVAPVLDALARS